jgi:predicted nuclease of predicted toxin-antitoxin system
MRLLVDMNVSPDICALLRAAGHEAVHWSTLGAPTASDESITVYASDHDFVVLTHDLDFGAILAATHADGPSVIQVRTGDVLSDKFVSLVSTAVNDSNRNYWPAQSWSSMRVGHGCAYFR